MAQAARLNLRMQKELKLLASDPPPGASFPSLPESSSLTSIDADFEGPAGTVYADGVFRIKIQIPDRYPFQPPVVNFVTPVYHPNIDNAGRICLDILNLPPKGAWQPSLNISTVLISIGLLLSEPNPDDGLMHEASRDYKYNRQAFEQNARSMTKRYAMTWKSENPSHGCQTQEGQIRAQTEMEGPSTSIAVPIQLSTDKSGAIKKLSLGSGNHAVSKGKEIQDAHIHQMDIGRLEDDKEFAATYKRNSYKLPCSKYKQLIKVLDVHEGRNFQSNQVQSQTPSTIFPKSASLGSIENNHEQVSSGHGDYEKISDGKNAHQKKRTLQSSKCSQRGFKKHEHQQSPTQLGSTMPIEDSFLRSSGKHTVSDIDDEKENLKSIPCMLPQSTNLCSTSAFVSDKDLHFNETSSKQTVGAAAKPFQMSALKPLDQLKGVNNQSNLDAGLPSTLLRFPQLTNDTIFSRNQQICANGDAKVRPLDGDSLISEDELIVLDSEDSEDDNSHMRSKLSKTRKPLSRKRKVD